MVKVWYINETFTHGFLIIPISLWLIWQKRKPLSRLPTQPSPFILAPIFGIMLIWLISQAVDVQVISQLALFLLVPLIIWLLLGLRILLFLLFPVLYLFFSVPIGESLIPPLMEFTANFTVYMVELVGIPVYRDGLYFSLPSGEWSVIEECSGVRYLIASLALGAIYAYINYTSNKKRFIFLIASILVPIIANGLRAFGIVMIGHFSGMKLAVGVDHLVYGWAFFGIVIFLMFFVGSFWWDPVPESEDIKKFPHSSTNRKSLLNATVIYAAAAFFIILTIKWYAYQVTHNKSGYNDIAELVLPDNIDGWEKSPRDPIAWTPEFKNPDIQVSEAYQKHFKLVQIDIAAYLFQRTGAETITSDNRITNPYSGEWKITYSSTFSSGNFTVNEFEIRRSNQKLLVWQWYNMGRYHTQSPYIAKVYEAYNLIIEHRNDGAFITISAPLSEVKSETRKILSEFLNPSVAEIDKILNSLINKHSLQMNLENSPAKNNGYKL
jgi:exosortase A